MDKKFQEALQTAKKTVDKWPTWKQNSLLVTTMATTPIPRQPIESTKNKEQPMTIQEKSKEYKFEKEIQINQETWRIYSKDYQDHATILDPITFIPYTTLTPITKQHLIATNGDTIKDYATVIKPGQTVECVNYEVQQDLKAIIPTQEQQLAGEKRKLAGETRKTITT
jgi:hypothetical protein